MGDKSKEKKFDPQGMLNIAFDFNKYEIDIMRNHSIPYNQRNRMKRKLGINIVGGSLIFLLTLLVWWFAGYLLVDVDFFDAGFAICMGIFVLIMVVPPTIGSFRIFRDIYGLSRDLIADRVEQVEGRVSLRLGSGNKYVLDVGNEETFRLDKKNFVAFRTGDPYVIYYTKHGKRILGAEWIDGVRTEGIFDDSDDLADLEDFLTDEDLFPFEDDEGGNRIEGRR